MRINSHTKSSGVSSFYMAFISCLFLLSIISGCASEQKTISKTKTVKLTVPHPADQEETKQAESPPPASGKSYTVRGKRYYLLASARGYKEEGIASWYGRRFHGRRTASGERFNMNAMTAAHKTLPFGSMVKVTNPANNRSVIVRINDRGPFGKGKIIDLSYAAAKVLGMVGSGTIRVFVEAVDSGV